MKTLELKLKKDVLIVDAEGLEITQALIFNKFGNYVPSIADGGTTENKISNNKQNLIL